MRRFIGLAVVGLVVSSLGPVAAATPTPYESLVLSLSWSPSWCATKAGQRDEDQCGSGKKFGFIVHGLWPQYARGEKPDQCPDAKPVPPHAMDSVAPVMPSHHLAEHEWQRHGACVGSDPASYFAKTKAAADRVKIPPQIKPDQPRSLTADQIRKAFLDANPGLAPEDIAVTCRKGRGDDAKKPPQLNDVRICLDNDLKFHPCPSAVHDRCEGAAQLPAVK